jgi:hypothetical protein
MAFLVQYHVHSDLRGLGLLLPVSCMITYLVIYEKNFKSHVQFADWCARAKICNSAEYSVLQALQFQEVSARRMLPGGTGISHN